MSLIKMSEMEKTAWVALWHTHVHASTHSPTPLTPSTSGSTQPWMGAVEVRTLSLCEVSRNFTGKADFGGAVVPASQNSWMVHLPLPEKFLQRATWKRTLSLAALNWILKVSSVVPITCTATNDKRQNWEIYVDKRTKKKVRFVPSNIISAKV